MSDEVLSPARVRYLLDANVFMTASHHYYSMDICPGFWRSVEHFGQQGMIRSIDRVRQEILSPPQLVQWATRQGNRFFEFSGLQDVVNVYSRMQTWAHNNSQFTAAAKEEFARNADGWLAAYARVNNYVVVTNEGPSPKAQRRVPLIDLCDKFEVLHRNPFNMLRDLGVSLDWSSST